MDLQLVVCLLRVYAYKKIKKINNNQIIEYFCVYKWYYINLMYIYLPKMSKFYNFRFSIRNKYQTKFHSTHMAYILNKLNNLSQMHLHKKKKPF